MKDGEKMKGYKYPGASSDKALKFKKKAKKK